MKKRTHALTMLIELYCNTRGANRTVIVQGPQDKAWGKVTCRRCLSRRNAR